MLQIAAVPGDVTIGMLGQRGRSWRGVVGALHIPRPTHPGRIQAGDVMTGQHRQARRAAEIGLALAGVWFATRLTVREVWRAGIRRRGLRFWDELNDVFPEDDQ